MRRILVGLVAAGSLTGVAAAQPAAQPPAPPAGEVQYEPAPPIVRIPQRSVLDAIKAFEAANAPKPGVVAAKPIPAPPPAPTDATAVAVLSVLEQVCLPAVRGGDVAALAKGRGLAKKRDTWVYAVAKPSQITVQPQGVNKNVCILDIDTAPGATEPVRKAVEYWALTRQPILVPYRDRDTFDIAGIKRTTSSWEDVKPDGSSTGVVFVDMKKPDGSSMSRNADKAQVHFSVRGPA